MKAKRKKPEPTNRYNLCRYSDESLRAIASGTNPAMAKVAQSILDNRKCPYPLHK